MCSYVYVWFSDSALLWSDAHGCESGEGAGEGRTGEKLPWEGQPVDGRTDCKLLKTGFLSQIFGFSLKYSFLWEESLVLTT